MRGKRSIQNSKFKIQHHKVSLYIPCHNAERYVARTLEGALRQTHPLDEILVIDDGSRDHTREIASRYPVRIVSHDRNRGLAAARNTGFRSARNELVASLDADCVAEPDWLEKLLPHLDDPKVAAAGGRLEETVLTSLADRWRQVHLPENWGDSLVLNPPFLFGANGLHRKSMMEKVGGYDEVTWIAGCGEDTAMSTNLRKSGYHLIYDPAALVKHIKQDTVRSVLDTRWRWWRYGVQAYFTRIRLRSVLATFYRAHFRTMFCAHIAQDWRSGNYEFLWVDFLCLFYMPYRDLKLYGQTKIGATRPPSKNQVAGPAFDPTTR
ncbi:MAG TPA: glycosyltransferase family 2 protein [Terriglobia bacterium]|nr:glycosyltransferase family 2 protein [Terriglobia bacterium]